MFRRRPQVLEHVRSEADGGNAVLLHLDSLGYVLMPSASVKAIPVGSFWEQQFTDKGIAELLTVPLRIVSGSNDVPIIFRRPSRIRPGGPSTSRPRSRLEPGSLAGRSAPSTDATLQLRPQPHSDTSDASWWAIHSAQPLADDARKRRNQLQLLQSKLQFRKALAVHERQSATAEPTLPRPPERGARSTWLGAVSVKDARKVWAKRLGYDGELSSNEMRLGNELARLRELWANWTLRALEQRTACPNLALGKEPLVKSAAGSSHTDDDLPPKPPKLRRQPVEAQIGTLYGDRAAFLLDEQVWQRERDERASKMRLRENAQEKRRQRRKTSTHQQPASNVNEPPAVQVEVVVEPTASTADEATRPSATHSVQSSFFNVGRNVRNNATSLPWQVGSLLIF